LRRLYAPSPFGQTHVMRAGPARSRRTPLVLLHLLPFSGVWWRPLQLAMADRPTFAVDLAGCGGSDPPPAPPPLADYAEAVLTALDGLGLKRVDLAGYHTGAAVAADIAARRPERVRRLVLAGIPLFDAAENAARAATLAPRDYGAPGVLAARWDQVRTWFPALPLERQLELFAESLRIGANGHWPVKAILDWDMESAMKGIRAPTLVPVLDESLKANTIAAAALIVGAQRLDLPGFGEDAFDVRSGEIAQRIAAFLDA
jgi:pimeloyl-ACP methyl ester carboxylesterase